MFYSLDELLDIISDKVKHNYGHFTDDDKNAICLRVDQLKQFIADLGRKRKTDGHQ